ncbi:McrB family protein [Tateyamaria sp. Alg231-49]|uniref:McrB family protein n=1 Tax=Tateyamaria sp. Alg231-49 TaxID=1922219 RepID=UPI001F47D156|nr:chromosome segregation ATPase-like protein [Tateyamaria sp. Alg231-49]
MALVIIMVVVAARADHANTLKPPLATLGEIDAQIRGKTSTLDDLEAELGKRRDAISSIADIQAEVDALVRQKDELLAEWQQAEDRRQEILALRQETDEAHTALATATRDLSEKALELEQVEARLQKAEQLVAQISELEESKAKLDEAVVELRGELSDLQTLQAREKDLRENIERYLRDSSRLEGEIDSFQSRRDEAKEGARLAQERLEEIKAVYTGEAAKLASQQTELTRMDAQRAGLLAQIESMKEKAGLAGSDGGTGADPLAELQSLPPVLSGMQKWAEHAARELETDALHRVTVHMRALGLDYHPRVIRAFHTAMKVNETTQMAVLAGISGTGKSQLPRRYAQAMGIGFLQVPVQPRWDSPQDLMGFYNYIEGKFRPTDLARGLYHLDKWNGPSESRELQDRMMLVLLDEMNLARVEYYFSDFLSRLESRPGIDQADRQELRKDAELELDIPMPKGESSPRIFPGYNVLFAGTMNEDESTQSLSDKVVDRANVMRFAAPKTIMAGTGEGTPIETKALSRSQWRTWVKGVDGLGAERNAVESHVEKMVGHMTALGRPIGHRLGRAMIAYAANYPEDNGRRDVQTALADQVEMRLLPKLRGVEMETASSSLDQLAEYVQADLNDTILADAIRDSARLADEGTGQFVWRGVTR